MEGQTDWQSDQAKRDEHHPEHGRNESPSQHFELRNGEGYYDGTGYEAETRSYYPSPLSSANVNWAEREARNLFREPREYCVEDVLMPRISIQHDFAEPNATLVFKSDPIVSDAGRGDSSIRDFKAKLALRFEPNLV